MAKPNPEDIVSNSSIRIDKLLYYLRFAKSRSVAQKMAQSGFIRINGQRVEHGHEHVRIQSNITMPYSDEVIVILIKKIPKRRGSFSEANKHYDMINTVD